MHPAAAHEDAPAPPAAVVFDWGNTLTDPSRAAPDLLDLWRAAARHLDPERADALAERLVAVEEGAWRRAVRETLRSFTLTELLAEASAATGLDVAEAVLEEAATRHLDAWTPHVVHDPEAAGVLRALRERGLALGLLSNTHWPAAVHERFLERDGLADLLDARVYTSDLPHLKPHPSAFRAVLDALGVRDPARAVFVGDRQRDDVSGAQALGMRAVWRPHPSVPPEPGVTPDGEIAALPELLPLIDAWSAQSPGSGALSSERQR